jgi:hypothetical protein
MAILKFNPLLYCAEVITQVKGVTCWLNAGKYPLLGHEVILA